MPVCKKCGLPEEICACGSIAKEQAKIKIYTVKRRFGKSVTVIEGIAEDAGPKAILKLLKSKLAAGGTYKDGIIEIQGTHIGRAKNILLEHGFTEDQIEA